MKSSCVEGKVGVNGHDHQAADLEQLQGVHRGDHGPPVDPGQHVDDFRQIERADVRRLGGVPQLAFDVSGRGLVEQQGDDRLGVKDRQLDSLGGGSVSASSSRVWLRASAVVGSWSRFVRSAPLAAPMGSCGRGRKTNSSPRSSTSTRFVPHRWRTSAGIDTWPPLEIDACLMRWSIAHEEWLST